MTNSMQPARPALRTLGRLLFLAPVALLLSTASSARAANLDEALLKAAPDVLAQLKMNNYKYVGVLPFRVQKGPRQASYLAGPLGSNLPGRLENAMIMGQGSNEARAIGVLRDAAATANKEKVGSFASSPAAFRKLFDTKYDLAWGQKKVKADAFLTGVVINKDDRSKTTIQMQLITPTSREGGKLKTTNLGKPITVNTDRSLLRDLGYTYALSRSVLKRGVSAKRRDMEAVDQVVKQEQGQNQQKPTQSKDITPDNIAGMAFELRYDGVKQALTPMSASTQGAKSRQFQAAPPSEGATVTMVLTRLLEDNKRLGVVLRVNGESTFQQEKGEPMSLRKWVYDLDAKDKPDEVRGIYSDAGGKNVRKFRVASAEESAKAAAELGDRAGWIDLDVFASVDGSQSAKDKSSDGDEEEMKVSTRGMPRSKKSFDSLKDLQVNLRKANHVKLKKLVAGVRSREVGGLLLPEIEASEEAVLVKADMPSAVHLGGITIRYYDPKAGGGEPAIDEPKQQPDKQQSDE